jgi:hypothetical protein
MPALAGIGASPQVSAKRTCEAPQGNGYAKALVELAPAVLAFRSVLSSSRHGGRGIVAPMHRVADHRILRCCDPSVCAAH